MKKIKKNILNALIIALAVLFGQGLPVYAYSNSVQAESRFSCKATLKDEFVDDAVIVVLNKEASSNFKSYTIDDFGEIDSISIEDLTELSADVVKQQIAAEKNRNWSGLQERIDSNMLVDIDSFRRILRIELKAKGKENVLEAIRQLEKRDDLLSAEPDYIFRIAATPNDPGYINNGQWGLNGNRGIQAPEAWSITTGHAPVKVGVLDTGIDGQHEDLISRINDDLHRDYVDTPLFSNVRIIDRNDLTDSSPNGHGTRIAGIIGAETNNGLGISGVCWNVRLISLRVANASGTLTAARIKRAVDFATDSNIPILNLSAAGGSFSDLLNSQKTAIQNYPGLFVCAAGNSNNDNDTNPVYPSNYRLPNLISVGAIRSSGYKWEYSNYGATTVDIFSPGHEILSTIPGNNYGSDSGTSLATPFVTGTAALMLSVRPYLTAEQIKNAIMNNAVTDDEGTPLNGLCVSNGRLNAFKAISSVALHTYLHHSGSGMAINGFAYGYTMPQNTHLILPERFARLGETEQRDVVAIDGFNEQNNLISVTIPDSVTSISIFAFENCTSLSNINLSNNLTRIDSYAFKGCTSLSSITIPHSVTHIYFSAFENCTNLTSINLSNNLTAISSSTFRGCTSLESITIPNSVIHIHSNAFENCTNLTNITLSNNLTTIGSSAFRGCTSLSSIAIPNSVTTINDSAFENCTSLESIALPNTLTSIGTNAFYGCINLSNITREFDINASSSNHYFLTIQNIGNAIVKINGVITTSVNNSEVIYLNSGNHSITVEATEISEILSTPIIDVAISQTDTLYFDFNNPLNFFIYQNIFNDYHSVQIGVMIDGDYYYTYTFYNYVFYSDWSHPEGSFNIYIHTGGITVGGDLGLDFERVEMWYVTGTYFT